MSAGEIKRVRFDALSHKLVIASDNGIAKIQTVEGEDLQLLDHQDSSVLDAEFSRDGSMVVTASPRGATVWLTVEAINSVLCSSGVHDLSLYHLSEDDIQQWAPEVDYGELQEALSDRCKTAVGASVRELIKSVFRIP